MKHTKKILSVFLAFIMIISIIPMSSITASAEIISGTCGDNLTWTFDESTGTLTISGTGAMEDYNKPWEDFESDICTVIIENGVTTICDYAFYICTNLTSVTFPDSVISIGYSSFFGCTSLEYIKFGKGISTIGEHAFRNCKSLSNIIIPDSVISIGRSAFSGCESLINITISNGLTSISMDLFYNCTKLTNVTIPNSVTAISEESFACCTSLTNIIIPNSIKTIGELSFFSCNNLTDVYYSGTVEQWNSIIIGEFNDPLLNATIHFNSHIHKYESVVTPPTCTEQGYTTYTCECGDSYVDNYVEPSHTPKTITIPASCTVAGMEYDVCEICGETIGDSTVIPATGHTAGEWETVLEPTYEADGKKVKKCTVCGEVVAEEVIPMLVKVTVTDEDTGVSMEYGENDYNGEVEIVVEESFDGTAFDVIDTSLNASQKFIYDITMTVDGVATQPNGAVTIRIPLPAGYDPNRSFVYHVNTETGTVEKMPATYENGYLVFETTHFSYYAVVEEGNYTFSIQSPSRTEIRNKDGIILHAVVDGNAPDGSYVRWESSNGNFDKSADGSNLRIIAKNKGWTMFTAILCDADGNELARDSVEMYSKSGFFDKIGGFFRSLFGTTKIYEN